jgi:glycine cleavage system H protein
MNTPSDLRYTKEHEWVKIESDDVVVFGITDFAQSALGDVVFASLPKVGASLTAGQTCGEVESTKSVSDIYSPVTGVVKEINEKLANSPEILNSDPYGAGWMVKLSGVSKSQVETLLDAAGYQKITESA